MSLTHDFSGSYDYEQTEAKYCAEALMEDLEAGYYDLDSFNAAVLKERQHWKKTYALGFEEWDRYFTQYIGDYLTLKGLQHENNSQSNC
jgi:hypothetical protein